MTSTTKSTFESFPAVSAVTYQGVERIILPLPPQNAQEYKFEMDVYARFMRHLRHISNSSMDLKILSSIQFTADMMNVGADLVSKTLIDLGLRAPRAAFPAAFLDFADAALQRVMWDQGSPSANLVTLQEFWDGIGEGRFAHIMAGRIC